MCLHIPACAPCTCVLVRDRKDATVIQSSLRQADRKSHLSIRNRTPLHARDILRYELSFKNCTNILYDLFSFLSSWGISHLSLIMLSLAWLDSAAWLKMCDTHIPMQQKKEYTGQTSFCKSCLELQVSKEGRVRTVGTHTDTQVALHVGVRIEERFVCGFVNTL